METIEHHQIPWIPQLGGFSSILAIIYQWVVRCPGGGGDRGLERDCGGRGRKLGISHGDEINGADIKTMLCELYTFAA